MTTVLVLKGHAVNRIKKIYIYEKKKRHHNHEHHDNKLLKLLKLEDLGYKSITTVPA